MGGSLVGDLSLDPMQVKDMLNGITPFYFTERKYCEYLILYNIQVENWDNLDKILGIIVATEKANKQEIVAPVVQYQKNETGTNLHKTRGNKNKQKPFRKRAHFRNRQFWQRKPQQAGSIDDNIAVIHKKYYGPYSNLYHNNT